MSVLQFSSVWIVTSAHPKLVLDSTGLRARASAQACPHCRCRLQICGPQFYPTWLQSWGFTQLPSPLLTISSFLSKEYISGIARWKRRMGQSMGGGMGSFRVLSVCAALPPPWFVHQLEAHWTSLFVGFTDGHYAGITDEWLTQTPSFLCSLLRFWGWSWHFQTSNQGLVFFDYWPPSWSCLGACQG